MSERADASSLVKELVGQYTSASTCLIDGGQAWASVLVTCCGTDALAGLYAGRVGFGSTEKEFVRFVKEYMPAFRPPPPSRTVRAFGGVGAHDQRGQLVWSRSTKQSVESCAEVLYRGYRCGLIHQGKVSPGLVVVVRQGPLFVFDVEHLNGEVAYKMTLNAPRFRDSLHEAVERYAGDLTDESVQQRFWRRWNTVTGPQWTLIKP